jgi:hypothetical protein
MFVILYQLGENSLTGISIIDRASKTDAVWWVTWNVFSSCKCSNKFSQKVTNSPKKKRFSPHFVASSLEWKQTMPNYLIFNNFSILYLLYENEMDIIQNNPTLFCESK